MLETEVDKLKQSLEQMRNEFKSKTKLDHFFTLANEIKDHELVKKRFGTYPGN